MSAAAHARRPDMAQEGREQQILGLPGGNWVQWPLQHYGRFMLLGTGEPPGSGLEAGMTYFPTWKVFYSSEESGYLVLTIVISGHFFISQGQTLLEGFSLIGSKNWLKMDKSRMFRVQFGGKSPEQALGYCQSCVQSLAQYITVQASDRASHELPQPGPPMASGSAALGCELSVPEQHRSQEQPEQQQWVPAGTSVPGRTSVTQLAQSLLVSEERPLVSEQPTWSVEELGPFLRMCLLDQNFPAFVGEVERELKKLTGLED